MLGLSNSQTRSYALDIADKARELARTSILNASEIGEVLPAHIDGTKLDAGLSIDSAIHWGLLDAALSKLEREYAEHARRGF